MNEEGRLEESLVESESPDLKREAALLRAEIRASTRNAPRPQYSLGRRVLYLVCVCATLGVCFILLGSQLARSAVVGVLAGQLVETPAQEPPLFELPAPPPKPAPQTTQYASSPIVYSEEGFDGVLYADSSDYYGSSEKDSEPTFVAPSKSDSSRAAFQLLQSEVAVAGQIVAGEHPEFLLKEWTPLKDDPPVVLIDLVVIRSSDDREVHFVWEINLDSGSARPMSQAARDLSVAGQ